jgi:E3 ubiquitin-protein ligase Hakai
MEKPITCYERINPPNERPKPEKETVGEKKGKKETKTLSMLQIRLSKVGGTSDSGGAASGAVTGGGDPAKSASAAAAALGGVPESVTVACPDHLVIADLPVAKSLGAVTNSSAAATRTIGRRSRRPLGERVHICSRCEFPIAIYGRLVRSPKP